MDLFGFIVFESWYESYELVDDKLVHHVWWFTNAGLHTPETMAFDVKSIGDNSCWCHGSEMGWCVNLFPLVGWFIEGVETTPNYNR